MARENHLQFSALCLLHAWEQRLPVPGGWAQESALRALQLDYSVASLERIDRFIAQWRPRLVGQGATFLEDAGHRNLLHLLAFYAGELIGRARRTRPRWTDWMGVVDSLRVVNLGFDFLNQIACEFNDRELTLPWFLPLHAVLVPLFDAQAAGLAHVCQPYLPPALDPRAPLPPLPPSTDFDPRDWPPIGEELTGLLLRPPSWIEQDSDPLLAQFRAAPMLLAQGRSVAAVLIQANNDLFEVGDLPGAPAAVVYDPSGRVPLQTLQAFARRLFELKGQPHADPDCAAFGALLADEVVRFFARPVPQSISPWPLLASTLYIDRRSLPDGVLQSVFPLLMDDAQPGPVMLLPPRYWPDWLEDVWMARSKARHGQVRSQAEVITEVLDQGFEREQSERALADQLFNQAYHLMSTDLGRAHQLYEQAAALGSVSALNNLGAMYAEGKGVRVNHARAQGYFQRAAQLGDSGAMINLGLYLWDGRAGVRNQEEALRWFDAADAAGDPQAREILASLPRGSGRFLDGAFKLLGFTLKGMLRMFLNR
jgi:hypothetical protein